MTQYRSLDLMKNPGVHLGQADIPGILSSYGSGMLLLTVNSEGVDLPGRLALSVDALRTSEEARVSGSLIELDWVRTLADLGVLEYTEDDSLLTSASGIVDRILSYTLSKGVEYDTTRIIGARELPGCLTRQWFAETFLGRDPLYDKIN